MSTRDHIINAAIILVMLGVIFYISFFSRKSKEVNAPQPTKVEVAPVMKCATSDCRKGA